MDKGRSTGEIISDETFDNYNVQELKLPKYAFLYEINLHC